MPANMITKFLEDKLKEELRLAYGKKVVAYPKFIRILWYVLTPPFIGLAVLSLCLDMSDNLIVCILLDSFYIIFSVICIAGVIQSGFRLVYSDTEIEITTLWRRKRHYSIIDIKKVSSTLYFYHVTFSDGFFVILTDSMTMSAEFYGFAKKNAPVVKGKY
ncbi:MAG: hypothetical protein IJ496_10065 [Ruminococcus sp.]|nr:hypothetical protein [Ruminococcus sp.]